VAEVICLGVDHAKLVDPCLAVMAEAHGMPNLCSSSSSSSIA
jgi:hypothetical protein